MQIVLAEWPLEDGAVVSVIFCARGLVLREYYPDPTHVNAAASRAIIIEPHRLCRLDKAIKKAIAIMRKTPPETHVT
jgi:hypothetical protein